jgi:hypothetical protein
VNAVRAVLMRMNELPHTHDKNNRAAQGQYRWVEEGWANMFRVGD